MSPARWTAFLAALTLALTAASSQQPAPTDDETSLPAGPPAGDEAPDAARGAGLDPLQRLMRRNRAGNRAFDEGDLPEAVRQYIEAQGLAPDDPRVLYNLGNALAGQDLPEEARSALEDAALRAEGALRRDAHFNTGVVHMEQEDWQGALRSFGQALTVDPTDEGARRNLELALRRLKQQEQQQQQQQDGDEGEQDEQQQQEQQEQQQEQEDQEKQDQKGDQQQDEQEQQQQEQQQQQQQDQKGEEQQEQQQPQGSPEQRDAELEAARRLLQALEEEEKEALKKALMEKIPDLPDRKEDW